MTFIFALALLFGFQIDANTYAVPFDLVSTCSTYDQEHAFIDTDTWTLYGDQDGNGLIDGDDCNWK